MGRCRGPSLSARSSHPHATRAAAVLLASFAAWATGCEEGGTPETRLLLLVSVDTLRSDQLAAYGSERGLTPRIDALAKESLVFTAAYAPASHTLPSISALLTGRYPEELGVWSNGSVLPAGVPTLARAFRQAGWRTAAVVSNWILRRETGLDAGFEHFDDHLPELEATRPMPERLAPDTTRAALDALDACLPAAPARCLLWVHYQDPHGPYTPPAALRKRELAGVPPGPDELPVLPTPFGPGGIPSYQFLEGRRDAAFYRAGYAGEVAFLDTELGRLLDGVSDRGLDDRAVVVFTADHGESLGEQGYWFSHGELLTDPQVRVPLLLRVPGRAPGRRNDTASLVDLLPTLSGLLLGAAPDADRPGRALLAPGAEQDASSAYLAALRGADTPRYGLVDGGFKYVVELRDGVWHGRLSRSDLEEVDLTAPAPQEAARMRGELEKRMKRYRRIDVESRRDLSPADREKLEALGYLAP